MGQKHLNLQMRKILSNLLIKGYSQRQIASILGYSQATISLQVKKKFKGKLLPTKSQ